MGPRPWSVTRRTSSYPVTLVVHSPDRTADVTLELDPKDVLELVADLVDALTWRHVD